MWNIRSFIARKRLLHQKSDELVFYRVHFDIGETSASCGQMDQLFMAKIFGWPQERLLLLLLMEARSRAGLVNHWALELLCHRVVGNFPCLSARQLLR